MDNWLDQFSAYTLLQPQQPVDAPPMITAAPMPPSPDQYDMASMMGVQPVLPPMLFGPPKQQDNWRAPMKYTPPVEGSHIPQVDLATLTDLVRKGESSGNYQALNREQRGNTASGAYQYTDSTWNGYGGYAKAMLAPKHVQDRRFQEDLAKRYNKYRGDPFKIIAEHYLPAAANNPALWTQPYRLRSGKTVRPVAEYVAHIVKNTPLEKAFNEYLARQH